MDRFEEMRTFEEVARHGVNGAARRLHLAPSAVSRRVRDLEARLGASLFDRAGRSMVLTEAGTRYFEAARALLADLLEAETKVRDAQGELSGPIKLAAPLSFGLAYIMASLNRFLALHPGVVVDLDLNDRRVDVAREGFDLAIRLGELESSSLVARRIGGCSFVLAASPAYLARAGEVATTDDLSGRAGLCYAPKRRPPVVECTDPRGRRHEVHLAPKLVSGSGDALRSAAIAGLGVLCEPRFLLEEALERGDLVALLADHDFGSVAAYALWPPRDYMPARVRALIEHIANDLKALA